MYDVYIIMYYIHNTFTRAPRLGKFVDMIICNFTLYKVNK